MSSTWYRRALILLCVVLAAASLLAAREYQGEFERSLAVTGPVELEVTTGSGNIEVRAEETSKVRITGRIHVDHRIGADQAEKKIQALENNPPIEQTGNYIRVGRIADPELRRHVSISYELVVPKATQLKSETGSGDESITGVKGPVKATTGSGNIRLAKVSEESRVDTGSGDIEVSDVTGTLSAGTGSGNIRASGIAGGIRAHTGSGDIRLEQAANQPVKVETGSGNLEIHGVRSSLYAQTGSGNITVFGEPGGDWKLETGSGNASMHLSPQASFNLHAHTGSGSIESSQPITMQGKLNRSEWRGTVRNGGPLVDVGTGSGDIHIE